MATSTWDQRRAQIAQALAGGGGGFGIGSGGMVNPMLQRFGSPAGGGQTQGDMMAYANQQLQNAPGFNYVPPTPGPPPAPEQQGQGTPGMATLNDVRGMMFGVGTPNQQSLYGNSPGYTPSSSSIYRARSHR